MAPTSSFDQLDRPDQPGNFDFTSSIDFSLSKLDTFEGMSVTAASLDEAAGRMRTAITTERIERDNLLLGSYLVVSDAISGGMGSVWRVRHQEWGMDLAMKRPHPRFFAEAGPARKAAFVAECENWINLGLHPNIVSCYYVREVGGVPTVFSEWMDGGSLKDALASGALYHGTPDEQVERILDIAIQTVRGLAYSHACGLLHQDVKPGNILLTSEGDAKVADFGLAQAASHAAVGKDDAQGSSTAPTPEAPTSSGYTLAYCPREQAEGDPAAAWMDIYAWAVTIIEALFGERPWQRGSEVAELFEPAVDRPDLPVPDRMLTLLDDCLHRRDLSFDDIERELVETYAEATGHRYLRERSEAARDTAESMNNRALSFLDLGRRDEAMRLLDAAEEKNPACLEVAFNRGALLWQDGKVDDIYLRDRLLQFGWKNDLSKLVAERRGAISSSRHAFRLRAELENTEGRAKLAGDRPVHDFALVDDTTAILQVGKGVSSGPNGNWMEYAIALPGQEFKKAPLEYVVWNLEEDEYITTVNEGSSSWCVAAEAPRELVDRALAAGWTSRTPSCTTSWQSADQTLLLLGFAGAMCLVEGETGRCIRTYDFGCAHDAQRVAFSSDGRRVYACQSHDGVPASWGLCVWDTIEPNWELPRLICRAQSVKRRVEHEEAFARAMADFERQADAGHWRAAAEALATAEQTSGFEHDPTVIRGYERLAVEAVPTGVADFDLVHNLRRVIGDRRQGAQMSPDGRYACFTNGKVWDLVDNHLVYQVELDFSDGDTAPIGFTADGRFGAYAGERSSADLTVIELGSGQVVDAGECGLCRADFQSARGKEWQGTRSPSVIAPDGVTALVAEAYYELDACGIDFIDTRTGERIAREKTYIDPMWDLMPKDICISRDARHVLYIFQGNANTIAVYCAVRWAYPEQGEPLARAQEKPVRGEGDAEYVQRSSDGLALVKRIHELETALSTRKEELASLSALRFARKRQLSREIAALEAELATAREEYDRTLSSFLS